MAECRIDGLPVLDGPVSWPLRAGTTPTVEEFEMSPDDAGSLVSGALRPVTLTIGSLSFRFLYVLQIRPAGSANTMMVQVADRRWFWSRALVSNSFNMRRNVGIKRVKSGFDAPEIDPLVPTVQYAPWSLNGGYPWSAPEALERIWGVVAGPEREVSGTTPALSISPDIAKLKKELLPLEDVELNDSGDVALARILRFIPGARITVDPGGSVRVYSVASGADRTILDEMGDEQVDGGHVENIDNSRIRPRAVRVFFAPEVEIRFDFNEGDGTGGDTLPNRGTNDPYLDNVLPIPDYQLSFGGRPLAQGTYMPIVDALSTWGAIPNFGPLTIAIVRKALVPYMDLWAGPRVAGLGDKKADWGARIAAVQQHFRRTYRINRNVVNRVQSIRAYRIGTIDPPTGGRAPSTAYQDWSVVATQRFLATQLGKGADSFAYAMNMDGYPENGELSSDDPESPIFPASPVRVSVVDSDQGIIRLEFLMDEFRLHEQILPSKMLNIPTGEFKLGGLFAWNARHSGSSSVPALSPSHKVAVVLTVIPAAPNSKARLFHLERTPGDVAGMLPAPLRSGIGDAKGPTMDVLVGPGWETARIPWVDRHGKRIKTAIGISLDDSVHGAALDQMDPTKVVGVQNLAEFVMNLGSQKGLGNTAASLDAISNAVAASIYAGFADRPEGAKTVPADHEARIDGFISRIVYRVMPDGEASMQAITEERSSPLEIMAFMPVSVRKLILKLATSAKVDQ